MEDKRFDLHVGSTWSRLVIYYSQSITITITFENIQSITITITFENFKSITITLASITSITFYYILLQFGAKLRGNFNTEIKLTGYSIHIILLKMLQIMPYKDKISLKILMQNHVILNYQ